MSEKNLPLSGEEIILDKDKTFAYFMYGTFVRELPPILLKEIKTIIRQLVKSGKNTLLVQNGKGIEKYVINTFIALKKESPSLRIIKVVYKNDSCDLAISDLADHAGSAICKEQSFPIFLCKRGLFGFQCLCRPENQNRT